MVTGFTQVVQVEGVEMMFERCLFCRADLGDNSVVETFSAAGQIAYDPIRGRLWAVCPRCGRWSLAPIESRWEVLEALERLTRDNARLLGQTENVGLFVNGDVRIVRVGHARLREEAWWRYTREVGRRRLQARRIIGRGKVTEAMVTLLLVGFPIWGIRSPEVWIDRARKKKFGRYAWQGVATCERCGRSDQAIELGGHVLLQSHPDTPDELTLSGYCRHCNRKEAAKFAIPSMLSEFVLRRSLAYDNFTGVSDEVLDEAVQYIEGEDTAMQFTRRMTQNEISVRSLPTEYRVALEIAVNEKHERELLSLELDALDARWRREEEIAAIVDRELTPGPAS